MATILIIDDHAGVREGLQEVIETMGHQAETAATSEAGIACFQKSPADLVFTDLRMAHGSGIDVLQAVRALDSDCPVVIMTAYAAVDAAVQSMRLGAFDFLLKPFSPELVRLKVAVALSLQESKRVTAALRAENRYLREEITGSYGSFIGTTTVMKKVFTTIERVASTDTSIAIYGESGTGKELVARAIHEKSRRASGPFIKVNCGALAENLLESEIFGHEQGAFTGAVRKKIGRFELAQHGTLFLDEIGDIPNSLQTKLLRVLQEREFERVGGEKTIAVDVRVVCATHRDLGALVQSGQFREDLYYRLHVVPISVPPLRDRRQDIPALCHHFLDRYRAKINPAIKAIDPAALDVLCDYAWPGNVRELSNVIEQALVFADGSALSVACLPETVLGRATASSATTSTSINLFTLDQPLWQRLDAIERSIIVDAYRNAKGVKTETAKMLGIKTSALYYKLEKYGIK